MNIDTIKDIIVARYKFIANSAARIVNTAQACGESIDLNSDALDEIDSCIDDIGANMFSFRQMLKALEVEGREETDE